MPVFTHDNIEIAFVDEGEGEPIVLVHGFASTKEVNWVAPGWVTTLTRAGRRVIALDNRGHGQSSKLYDPALYSTTLMAGDVRALLDHLGVARADVMGYSMGARIAAFLAVDHPGAVRSAILGGLGIRLVDGVGLPTSIADALEAPTLLASIVSNTLEITVPNLRAPIVSVTVGNATCALQPGATSTFALCALATEQLPTVLNVTVLARNGVWASRVNGFEFCESLCRFLTELFDSMRVRRN